MEGMSEFDQKCENCGGDAFVEDFIRGDTICSDCGAVLPELMMDEQLEVWKSRNAVFLVFGGR